MTTQGVKGPEFGLWNLWWKERIKSGKLFSGLLMYGSALTYTRYT